MQIVSTGDNLHEMSKPIFWGNTKSHEFVICWICPESGIAQMRQEVIEPSVENNHS